jgi:hypothetical protein
MEKDDTTPREIPQEIRIGKLSLSFFMKVKYEMDWPHLEGTDRVMACYREWKRYKRLRKRTPDRRTRKFLKEDMLYEFDELVDAILSLSPRECAELRAKTKSDVLYHLLLCYGHSQYMAREP